MAKYYGSGWNLNGVLGLGDTANKAYFTEKNLDELKVVKVGGYTRPTAAIANMYPLNIMLLSDGHIYISGGVSGVPASFQTTLTKIFDADRLIDIYTEEGGTASSKTVWGITSTTIYRIVISWNSDTQSYQETHTIIDDSAYQWSNVYPKRLICGMASYSGERRDSIYIASDNAIYAMNPYTHELQTTLNLTANYMTAVPERVGAAAYHTLYVIDDNSTLWGYGRNNYGQIIPGGESTISSPYRMYDGVKAVTGHQRKVAFIDMDGGVHMWGHYANQYDIRGTGDNTETITDTSAFTTGYKNIWILGFTSSSAGGDTNYTVYLQKEDGTIWVNGQNTYGNAGIGTTENVNGIVQTSTTIYENVSVDGVCNMSAFIYEKDISIFCYVYSSDGSELLVTFNNLRGVKRLLVGGVLPATFRVTDYYNEQFNASIQYNTPREFLGLAYTPNASSPIFVAGNEYTVNFNVDTILYMVLGEAHIDQGIEIRTYKYSGEPNRVRKNEPSDVDGNYKYLSDYAVLTGTLRDECSIMKPVITFQMSVVPQFNYVYIPDFYRWYYVSEIESVNKNLWRMYLNCDVLCSFQDDIYSLKNVIISRSEYSGIQNGHLEDPYIRTYSNVEKVVYEDNSTPQYFGVGLGANSKCFLLDTIGKEIGDA